MVAYRKPVNRKISKNKLTRRNIIIKLRRSIHWMFSSKSSFGGYLPGFSTPVFLPFNTRRAAGITIFRIRTLLFNLRCLAVYQKRLDALH